ALTRCVRDPAHRTALPRRDIECDVAPGRLSRPPADARSDRSGDAPPARPARGGRLPRARAILGDHARRGSPAGRRPRLLAPPGAYPPPPARGGAARAPFA